MAMINDIVFWLYFKTVNPVNDKVDNCAHVNIAIFIVNCQFFFVYKWKGH